MHNLKKGMNHYPTMPENSQQQHYSKISMDYKMEISPATR